jgi:2-dehydro-3-deoxy-D-gluconate 5-dehydrogenase
MTSRSRPLQDRVAIVTGASRGIGRAIALRLDHLGAQLALVQRSSADETSQHLTRPAFVVQCDLSRAEEGEAAVARIAEHLGEIDVCVCNAGTIHREPALEVGIQEFRRVIEVNVVSTFAVARAAAAHMPAGGAIVLIGSVLSFQGGLQVPAYAASKAAVANLARALANEWASRGIRVNAVAPGYIDNEQTAPLRADAERRRQIDERIPAGRWGANEDVADAVAWLVCSESGYVNGHVLAVDGGWLGR